MGTKKAEINGFWIEFQRQNLMGASCNTNWGVWYKGCLYFGGGPETVRSKNIAQNKYVTFNLESGVDAPIVSKMIILQT